MLAVGQNPTTTYPYLYDNFIDGKVVLDNGKSEDRKMNVHLRRNDLHYIDNGVIKQAFLSNVIAVEIGKDIFVPVNGMMLKVVAKDDKACVAEQFKGDFEAAREAVGAYGTSSTTSATMKLTSIQTDSQINQNYMNILNEKDQGMSLPVESVLWIVTPSRRVPAIKREIAEIVPNDRKAEWKQFLKAHKIKWKNPVSLLQLAEFVATL